MSKVAVLLVIAAIAAGAVCLAAAEGYAADTQTEKEQVMTEKPNTIFQKLGEIFTGECDMGGKPLKKTGIFQPMADGIKEFASGRSRESGSTASESGR